MNWDVLSGIAIGLLLGLAYGWAMWKGRDAKGRAPDDDQGATPRGLEDDE